MGAIATVWHFVSVGREKPRPCWGGVVCWSLAHIGNWYPFLASWDVDEMWMVLVCCVDNHAKAMSSCAICFPVFPFDIFWQFWAVAMDMPLLLLPGLKCFRMRNDPFLGIMLLHPWFRHSPPYKMADKLEDDEACDIGFQPAAAKLSIGISLLCPRFPAVHRPLLAYVNTAFVAPAIGHQVQISIGEYHHPCCRLDPFM